MLAGGQGQRMHGQDKGLLLHRGEPLALQALRRLGPQTGALAVSANRHIDAYRAFGVPVWADTLGGFAGPLAGWLTGLQHGATPYLASVPCDVPGFPCDLVPRLCAALEAAGAELAIARTAERRHPVFALIARTLEPRLRRYLDAGGRRVQDWALQQHCAEVLFEDEAAFANFNTPADLQAPRSG